MGQVPKEALPPTIRVERLTDALVIGQGHAITSSYVETFWLPVLGPTALWTARRLAAMVAKRPTIEIDVERLAQAIGVRGDRGPNDLLPLAFNRLLMFGVLVGGSGSYEVRSHLSELPQHRVAHLPEFLRDEHVRRTAAART